MITSMSSSERKHRDGGSTVAVQAGVQHGQDGRRQQGADSEMQVEQNGLSSSRVSRDPQGLRSLATLVEIR